MARKAVRDTAQAIRKKVRRDADRQTRNLRYAEVTSTGPLAAKLTDTHLTLDAEDLAMGQWARQYEASHGLQKGDTLLVHPMPNGDWAVVDVISDKDLA